MCFQKWCANCFLILEYGQYIMALFVVFRFLCVCFFIIIIRTSVIFRYFFYNSYMYICFQQWCCVSKLLNFHAHLNWSLWIYGPRNERSAILIREWWFFWYNYSWICFCQEHSYSMWHWEMTNRWTESIQNEHSLNNFCTR